MPKKDFTQVAFDVVQRATGATAAPAKTAKQLAGAKGGAKGGAKRMANMSAEERREMALKAANARWAATNDNAPASVAGAVRKG